MLGFSPTSSVLFGVVATVIFVIFFVVKYRLPSVFFSGNARLPSLVQSLESLPANVLDVPEACGLHSSPEVTTVLILGSA